jgi:hypothetical protein
MFTGIRRIISKAKQSEEHRNFFTLELKQFVGHLIFGLIVYTIYTILIYGTQN